VVPAVTPPLACEAPQGQIYIDYAGSAIKIIDGQQQNRPYGTTD
jgi:hypothetical protein